MSNIYRFSLVAFFLLIDFIAFAQGPGDVNGTGDLEGNDTPAAPINSKLILLLIIGLVYAYYQVKRYKKVS